MLENFFCQIESDDLRFGADDFQERGEFTDGESVRLKGIGRSDAGALFGGSLAGPGEIASDLHKSCSDLGTGALIDLKDPIVHLEVIPHLTFASISWLAQEHGGDAAGDAHDR